MDSDADEQKGRALRLCLRRLVSTAPGELDQSRGPAADRAEDCGSLRHRRLLCHRCCVSAKTAQHHEDLPGRPPRGEVQRCVSGGVNGVRSGTQLARGRQLRCLWITYSTVTDFARLRGWSTSVPLSTAT